MRCKQGDLAKIVADAPMELRGRIVRCVELVYTFSDGEVEPAWITDRYHTILCPKCGQHHSGNRFLDRNLQPLPGLPEEDTKENERELTTV